jgi:hypothetical protein
LTGRRPHAREHPGQQGRAPAQWWREAPFFSHVRRSVHWQRACLPAAPLVEPSAGSIIPVVCPGAACRCPGRESKIGYVS